MAARKKRNALSNTHWIDLLQETLSCVLPPDQAEQAANAISHRLLSLSGVILAPEDVLAKMPGMTPKAARLLHLTLELSRAFLDDQSSQILQASDASSAQALLWPDFMGRREEVVGVLLLDICDHPIYRGIVAFGAVSTVPLYVRDLVSLCIAHHADSLILAHNHPSENSMPSAQDIRTTQHLEMALRSVQVRLLDHIIFSQKESDVFSFASSGLLARMRNENLQTLRSAMANARELTPPRRSRESQH